MLSYTALLHDIEMTCTAGSDPSLKNRMCPKAKLGFSLLIGPQRSGSYTHGEENREKYKEGTTWQKAGFVTMWQHNGGEGRGKYK